MPSPRVLLQHLHNARQGAILQWPQESGVEEPLQAQEGVTFVAPLADQLAVTALELKRCWQMRRILAVILHARSFKKPHAVEELAR